MQLLMDVVQQPKFFHTLMGIKDDVLASSYGYHGFFSISSDACI